MRPENHGIKYIDGYVYHDGYLLYDDDGKALSIGRYERLMRKSIIITEPKGIGKSEFENNTFKEPSYLFY